MIEWTATHIDNWFVSASPDVSDLTPLIRKARRDAVAAGASTPRAVSLRANKIMRDWVLAEWQKSDMGQWVAKCRAGAVNIKPVCRARNKQKTVYELGVILDFLDLKLLTKFKIQFV